MSVTGYPKACSS